MTLLSAIAAQLNALRIQQGHKRYTLASDKVSPAAVQRVLAGEKNYTLQTLVDVAELLDAEVVITIRARGAVKPLSGDGPRGDALPASRPFEP